MRTRAINWPFWQPYHTKNYRFLSQKLELEYRDMELAVGRQGGNVETDQELLKLHKTKTFVAWFLDVLETEGKGFTPVRM